MNIKKLSQVVNNFYKLCEYSAQKEKDRRESREIPSRSQADISDLEQYIDKDYAIQFADLPKIGINPRSIYDTPVAICGYPLTRDIYNQLINNTIPFAQDRKYMHLFKIKDGLNVNDYNQSKYEQDLKKILELVKNNNEWQEKIKFDEFKSDEDNISKLIEFGETNMQPYPFAEMWNIGRLLCDNSIKWNHLLRYLEINAVVDNGNGILHSNEPNQVMIFNINNLELIKTYIGKEFFENYSKEKININKFKNTINRANKYIKNKDNKIININNNEIILLNNKNKIQKIELNNDRIEWYNENDKLHREDGPAIEKLDGDKYWYINGELHREDGPAVEEANGTKRWYVNGKHHREDGPAAEYANGDKVWYINGELHREDGPAVEYAVGGKEWYLNNKKYTEEEFNKIINKQ